MDEVYKLSLALLEFHENEVVVFNKEKHGNSFGEIASAAIKAIKTLNIGHHVYYSRNSDNTINEIRIEYI